ncbi:hypothetical protein Poly24_42940 [Rosistilla carotiformis]|uniref:Uncharacterized protein n=1 Tax=Rosistilla carotiformis TaxID=2528017 RepID=A0A518JYF5_9BACT|nr:hypothetical protein Poly24_42940 [Rosistilla carotiformis]
MLPEAGPYEPFTAKVNDGDSATGMLAKSQSCPSVNHTPNPGMRVRAVISSCLLVDARSLQDPQPTQRWIAGTNREGPTKNYRSIARIENVVRSAQRL